MKTICVIFTFIFYSLNAFSQQVPLEIRFNSMQVSNTHGVEHKEDEPSRSCNVFKKNLENIIETDCNNNGPIVNYTIKQVYSEKREQDYYSITYLVDHYYSIGAVKCFLTYTYNYDKSKWTILVEDVLDTNQDGIVRWLFHYFNF